MVMVLSSAEALADAEALAYAEALELEELLEQPASATAEMARVAATTPMSAFLNIMICPFVMPCVAAV